MTTAPPPLPPTGPDSGTARAATPQARSASCRSCGSQVTYEPGSTNLKCGACGATSAIEAGADTTVEEHSFDEWLAHNAHVEVASLGGQVLRCEGCAAQVETTDLAETCQFCSGHMVALTAPEGVVPPEAVIPFGVDRKQARTAFKSWVSSRWFAPNALKKVGSTEALKGTYVPQWSFDADTASSYVGERGEYYYVTKTRQVSDDKGGTRTESYQERRTRWHPASGRVARSFDDVLVPATSRLNQKRLEQMGPWKLETAVAYQPEYLSGYSALRYDVDPQEGSKVARKEMAETIADDVRGAIGGDEQRVHRVDTSYSQAMFKLMLLPLWLATYSYSGKQWQVMVNANTGKVTGDRPFSALKIALAVIVALLVAALIALVVLSTTEDTTTTAVSSLAAQLWPAEAATDAADLRGSPGLSADPVAA